MRAFLPALPHHLAIVLLLAAQSLLIQPALADYKAAENLLQAGDVAGAMPLLAEEAKLGNPVAAFNLAKIYEDGSGGVRDFGQAATYYKIAAEIDTAPRYNGAALGPQGPELIAAAQKYGQFALGRLYETGSGVPRDPAEAVFWYTRAADLGLQQAMLKLAVIYREGLAPSDGGAGIAADPAQSVAWLEKAATIGNVAAMNELGRAYLAGEGVLANPREAAKWFEQAAAAGSLTAEYALGSIYRTGFGGQPDFIRAVRHFERAANGKESASMVALGDLHANGQGVPQDRVQALAWYKLAALYGQPEGGKRGEILAAGMTPDEVALARTRAETWYPEATDGAPAAVSADPAVTPSVATPAMEAPAATMPAAETPVADPSATAPSLVETTAPAMPATEAVVEPAPAPLPKSTPSALDWVPPTPPAPSAPAAAPAVTSVPEAPPPPPTPTAAPAPVETVAPVAAPEMVAEPFDPFAPDPFALDTLVPQIPGGQPGAKPLQPATQP